MSLVNLETDADHLVADSYSSARGPVLRSDKIEFARVTYKQGEGANTHSHPEEQVLYVLSGRAEFTVGTEVYEVGPGQASFHPAGVAHSLRILEDVIGLSFKCLVAPTYRATGIL